MMQDVQSIQAAAASRLARLKSLLQLDAENAMLRRECVQLALEAREFDYVLELTGAVLVDHPKDTHALYARASALMARRDFRGAIGCLNVLRESGGGGVAADQNLALCHYVLGEHELARGLLEGLYAQGERSPSVLRLLVSSCHHLGLIDRALEIADLNLKAAASDAALAGVYALLYIDAQDMGKAERHAAIALALNPDSVDGLTARGTLRAARLDAAAAKADFSRARELAPHGGRAWIGLGTLALLEQDFQAAKDLLARGLELMPGHVGSWHAYGWTQLFAGEIDAAEDSLRRALALDRNFGETHGALATIAALRGQHNEAEQGIEVATRLDPDSIAARIARAVLLNAAGDPQRARGIMQQMLRTVAPQSAALLGSLSSRTTRH